MSSSGLSLGSGSPKPVSQRRGQARLRGRAYSLTAQCLVTLMDCTASAADAADELMAALEAEDFSALCRHVRNATGLTDSADAALAMLAALPALEEMLPGIPVDAPEGMFIPADLAVIPADRIPCLHEDAHTHPGRAR